MRPVATLILLGLALTACAGSDNPVSPSVPSQPGSAPPAPTPAPTAPPPARYPWDHDGAAWAPAPGTTPPACPTPLPLQTPVDLSRVTSILYPGQTRGQYKPHGGFAFDNAQSTAVDVIAPITGMIYRGSHYVESAGDQYLFDVISECGVMVRFDHLRRLSPRFQTIAAAFPIRGEGDTRTTFVPPGEMVTAGALIAVEIGVPGNVGVDFGVYDLRTMNAASRSAAWLSQHPGELAPYAVCWFDWLSPSDAARVRSLPSRDAAQGRYSDYCS